MAREEQRVAGLLLFKGHLVHGPPLHDAGVPVDEHAALHIGDADKARAINAPARFAAPAVLGAHILFGLRADGGAERFLAAAVPFCHGLRHQLGRRRAQRLGQCIAEQHAFPLGKHRRHRVAHFFQCHIPDIARPAVHQLHLRPALVGLGFLRRFRQAAQNAALCQLHHPHTLHPGHVQHVSRPAHQHQLLAQVRPQLFFRNKLQLVSVHIAVVAVKAHHLGHLGRQRHARRRHAAGGGAHLAGLPIQALVPNGGEQLPLVVGADRLRVVENGAHGHLEQCVFHLIPLPPIIPAARPASWQGWFHPPCRSRCRPAIA